MGGDFLALVGRLPGREPGSREFSLRDVFELWLAYGPSELEGWPEAALQWYREGVWLRVGVDILADVDRQPEELECELPSGSFSDGRRILVPRIVFPSVN